MDTTACQCPGGVPGQKKTGPRGPVVFPVGDGLTADAQGLRHRLLCEIAPGAGVPQSASDIHRCHLVFLSEGYPKEGGLSIKYP